jgi:hypothetical protein
MIKDKYNEFVRAQLSRANIERVAYKLLTVPPAGSRLGLTSGGCGRSRLNRFNYRK